MPSKSKKQAKFMRAVAHGWKPTRKKGPTQAVAKEFVNADRREKVMGYQAGGPANFRGYNPYGGADVPGMGAPRVKPLPRPDPYGATTGQSSLPPHLRNPGSGGGYPGRMGGALQQYKQRQLPMRDPRGMPPRAGGRGNILGGPGAQRPVGMRDPRQRIPGPGGRRGPPGRGGIAGGARGVGRDPRAMPPQGGRPRGALGSIYDQMQNQKGGPRRMVPPSPPRGYPGGGNPNLGGRNPMMRGARNRMGGGRGRTSFR